MGLPMQIRNALSTLTGNFHVNVIAFKIVTDLTGQDHKKVIIKIGGQ